MVVAAAAASSLLSQHSKTYTTLHHHIAQTMSVPHSFAVLGHKYIITLLHEKTEEVENKNVKNVFTVQVYKRE